MSHSCFVVAPNLQASQVSIKSSDQWSAESGRPFNQVKVSFSSHYRRSRCLLNRQQRGERGLSRMPQFDQLLTVKGCFMTNGDEAFR